MNTSTVSIQDILALIYTRISGDLAAQALDTVKIGDPSQPVRGVVTCFLATSAVLARAAALGANLIITHEPTFYNHMDQTAWLEGDAVYAAKKAFIERNGIVIWRFHDGMHNLQKPDGIVAGMMQKLGWEATADPNIFSVDPQPVKKLADACKERLGIQKVRVAGPLDATCQRIGLKVGASGGRSQIDLFLNRDVDVVVCGESAEWETCEYVRDANAIGKAKALIVLGHANSEEAGMEHLVPWLRTFLPAGIGITYVPTGDPFQFI